MPVTPGSITQDRLKQLFSYDPLTGIFKRIVTRRRGAAGAEPGFIKNGRRQIRVDGRAYLVHRLAWLYMHGSFPSLLIDHINGDPMDNRIANLREVTPSGNQQNLRRPNKNNTSGFLGVSYIRRDRKFLAQIKVDGSRKSKRLGYFETAEEASSAYLRAKKELHPFQTIA